MFRLSLCPSIELNPSHLDPGRRERINSNFDFHTSLFWLISFMKALKAFIKLFEAPQRSVTKKINLTLILIQLFQNARGGTG